jgi:hypothetical protein
MKGAELEGYAYLGAGVLALLAFALVGFLKPAAHRRTSGPTSR